MLRRIMLLVLAIGCGGGDGDECADKLPPGYGSDFDNSEDRGFPPTDPDGTPWPTFDEAVADLEDCTQAVDGYRLLRGTCSDGKLFLSREGTFAGDMRYYDAESGTLVGTESYSDFIVECLGDRGVGDARCERASVEEIVCP